MPEHYAARVFRNPDAYGLTMLVQLADVWGGFMPDGPDETSFLEWSPAALRQEIWSDFGVNIADTLFNRLMAAITVLTTNRFHQSLPDFIALCNALTGDDPDPNVFSPADSFEMAWGVSEAQLINPLDEDEEFAPEIRAYIGQVCLDEGYVSAPDVLRIGMNSDWQALVQYDYADDPELFQGIVTAQTDKTKELTDLLQENLQELSEQLLALKLKHGRTDFLRKAFAQKAGDPPK